MRHHEAVRSDLHFITLMLLAASATVGPAQESIGASQRRPPATLGVPGRSNSTPSLAIAGRMVVAVWTASGENAVNVYASTSHDGGASFSDPRRVNDRDGDASANNEQPPRVAITGGENARSITVFWSKRNDGPQRSRVDVIRMAQSSDAGQTFSPAKMLHDSTLGGARGWQSLSAGRDRALHAVWLDGRNAERKVSELMARSGTPHKGQPPQEVYHGLVMPDGRVIETAIAADVCFCCKTAVAVDARGGVYAAWRHIFPGSLRDIAFAKSADGGRRFDPLVRVSEDNWELNGCPEDGPAMAVDQSRVIHIAWSTLITNGGEQKAMFYATSRDGKTFSSRTRIPTAGMTNPGHPQLALTPDGGAAIAWDEMFEGVRRVTMTRVSRTGVPGPPQVLSGQESASHPVIAAAGAGDLLVAWTSRAATGKPDQSLIGLRRVSSVK